MKKLFRKDRLPLFIVGIVSLVVVGAVVSYTYSFFAVNKTNNNVIAGEAESMSIDLKVEKKAPNNDNKLVPQLDEYITSAVKGVNGSCVDGNNNNICQVYKITVKNGGSTTAQFNGEVVLDAKNNPNLKWAVISGEATSGAKPTLKSNVYSHTHKALTTKEEYTGGQTKEYYIVVWISETGIEQTDTGKFTGVVNFTNVNAGGGSWGGTSSGGNEEITYIDDKSGANMPAYTEGLIPIVYDDGSNKWVKADVTSSESEYGWYDYGNKKWANAALVKDSTEWYGAVINKTNKSVNINIPAIPTSYVGTLLGDGSGGSYGEMIGIDFTFKTGTTGGNLSFDASFSYNGESEYFGHMISLNDEFICGYGGNSNNWWQDSGGTCQNNYSIALETNTEYKLTVKMTTSYGTATPTISNISLPSNLAEPLSVKTSAWDSNGNSSDASSWNINNFVYSGYTKNENGKFSLTGGGLAEGNANVGKYICSDGTTECSEMYRIKKVNNNIITNVESYTITTENTTITREFLENAEAGTEIPEDMMLAQYVWIPRYKYKLFAGIDRQGIDIVFEEGTSTTGTVNCEISATGVETCTNVAIGNYYTHPAFTFGEDELTGFWMGKYELSYSEPDEEETGNYSGTDKQPKILPGMASWHGNNVSNFYTVIKNMQSTNNIYGLTTNTNEADSHILKNIEWGAVAYLTTSGYGRCNIGPDEESSECPPVEWNNYTTLYSATVTGHGGTTTGNKSGIYDMSGGRWELVMGNMMSEESGVMISDYSGFKGKRYTWDSTTYEFVEKNNDGTIDYPSSKYYDTYAYSNAGSEVHDGKHYGDATAEIWAIYDMYDIINIDYYDFITPDSSWFIRGASAFDDSPSGVFNYFGSSGIGHSDGTRAALAVFQ